MYPWWLLYLAVGAFAVAFASWLLACRHLRPGWYENLRGLPWWSRRGRPMWDDFDPAARRWLLLHLAGLVGFGVCLLAFAVAATR